MKTKQTKYNEALERNFRGFRSMLSQLSAKDSTYLRSIANLTLAQLKQKLGVRSSDQSNDEWLSSSLESVKVKFAVNTGQQEKTSIKLSVDEKEEKKLATAVKKAIIKQEARKGTH